MNETRDIGVDITNCDREPIHIPGAIQPHGVLLMLQEPDLIIAQASENASTLFGRDVLELVAMPLSSVLMADSLRGRRSATILQR